MAKDMDYERRIVAFIDFLGFKSLVSESQKSLTLTQNLYQMLRSVTSSTIHGSAYAEVNVEDAPPEEAERLRRDAANFRSSMQKKYPIAITHFSDSLVISTAADDPTASLTILDLLAKINVTVWSKFRTVTRGGIAVGSLIHEENGPLFGPALIDAYQLESNVAINPRILFSDEALSVYKGYMGDEGIDSYGDLIDSSTSESYISLFTSLNFLLGSESEQALGDQHLAGLMMVAEQALADLSNLARNTAEPRAKQKLQWLCGQFS